MFGHDNNYLDSLLKQCKLKAKPVTNGVNDRLWTNDDVFIQEQVQKAVDRFE
jgi:hypothetical protein